MTNSTSSIWNQTLVQFGKTRDKNDFFDHFGFLNHGKMLKNKDIKGLSIKILSSQKEKKKL